MRGRQGKGTDDIIQYSESAEGFPLHGRSLTAPHGKANARMVAPKVRFMAGSGDRRRSCIVVDLAEGAGDGYRCTHRKKHVSRQATQSGNPRKGSRESLNTTLPVNFDHYRQWKCPSFLARTSHSFGRRFISGRLTGSGRELDQKVYNPPGSRRADSLNPPIDPLFDRARRLTTISNSAPLADHRPIRPHLCIRLQKRTSHVTRHAYSASLANARTNTYTTNAARTCPSTTFPSVRPLLVPFRRSRFPSPSHRRRRRRGYRQHVLPPRQYQRRQGSAIGIPNPLRRP